MSYYVVEELRAGTWQDVSGMWDLSADEARKEAARLNRRGNGQYRARKQSKPSWEFGKTKRNPVKRRKKTTRKRVVRAVRRVAKKVRKAVRRVKRSAAPRGFKVVTQIEGCKVAITSGSFESAIRKAHALHVKTGTPATVLHGGAKLGVSTKRGFKY